MLALSLSVFASGCSKGVSGVPVEITNTRIESYVLPSTGQTHPSICIDWRNTGSIPITKLIANIRGYDAAGKLIYQAPNARIYDSSTAIAPGETYVEPAAWGDVLVSPSITTPTKVEVEVVSAQ